MEIQSSTPRSSNAKKATCLICHSYPKLYQTYPELYQTYPHTYPTYYQTYLTYPQLDQT